MPRTQRRGEIGLELILEVGDGLGTLSSGDENVGLDFDGGAERDLQIGIAQQRMRLDLVLRKLVGFLCVLVGLHQIFLSELAARHPTEGFNGLGGDAFGRAIAANHFGGARKIVAGDGFADVVDESRGRRCHGQAEKQKLHLHRR